MVITFALLNYRIVAVKEMQIKRAVSSWTLSTWRALRQAGPPHHHHSGVRQTAAATGRKCVFTFGREGASFRSAGAAQICSNVGLVAVDGVLECSVAPAARQIVSERW